MPDAVATATPLKETGVPVVAEEGRRTGAWRGVSWRGMFWRAASLGGAFRLAVDWISSLAPVFWFALVRGSRNPWTVWVRAGNAATLLFALWLIQPRPWVPGAGPPPVASASNGAADFFVAFSWLQIIAVVLVVPMFVATAIARERESRTIEYLFACPLSEDPIK